MASRGVNKVILIGNLGKDPEVKYFPNGDAFCNLTLATSESWNDKASGEKKEKTEWHNVVFTRKLAEIAGQYLKKGAKVYVEGSLRTRKWQDKEGQDRYTTEIRGDRMQMLGGRGTGGGMADYDAPPMEGSPRESAPRSRPPASSGSGAAPAGSGGGFGDIEDDIPF